MDPSLEIEAQVDLFLIEEKGAYDQDGHNQQ